MARISPMGRRLYEVQRQVGLEHSFREFWRTLVDEDFWRSRDKRPPGFSREAARTYLYRVPPASYLEAVVERFDVNPAWLLTGEPEGLIFKEQLREAQAAKLREADNPLWAVALEGVPELANWPTPARVLFLDVLGHYRKSFQGFELMAGQPEARRLEAVQALARDLFEMVEVPSYSLRPVSFREFTYYLVAMLHAVQLRIPDEGEGPHIFTRFNTLDPEYRRHLTATLEGLPEVDVSEILDAPLTETTPTQWNPSKGGTDA